MTQNIEGKVVVITGASNRLGEATAWRRRARSSCSVRDGSTGSRRSPGS
jgi:NADP-dependent 3-hydroxy acid dehydrogenase YdfG